MICKSLFLKADKLPLSEGFLMKGLVIPVNHRALVRNISFLVKEGNIKLSIFEGQNSRDIIKDVNSSTNGVGMVWLKEYEYLGITGEKKGKNYSAFIDGYLASNDESDGAIIGFMMADELGK